MSRLKAAVASVDGDADGRRRRLVLGGLAAVSWAAAGTARAQNDEFGDAALRGAGSTFVQPLMEAWVRQYRADPFQVLGGASPNGGLSDPISNDTLDYEPVGSLAGIQRIRAGFVDFAASEMPLLPEQLQRNGLLQFPWVTGGVAVVATLPSLAKGASLRLDARTLSGIFLGRIARWSDPEIARQNPGVALGDGAIAVVNRSDGSGTTFTLARWLSLADGEWKTRMGSDLLLKWPLGQGVRGSDEMVRALRSTPNAIGYVNVVQARRAGLPVVQLRNARGQFVAPEAAALAAAFASRRIGVGEHDSLPIDSPGDQSYPLVATVFGTMRTPIRTLRQRRAAEFVAWTLTRGAGLAGRLGYLGLPEPTAKAIVARLTQTA